MPRLYLVRHGKTASLNDPDPGLADTGLSQAAAVAAALAPKGPLPILSSPSRRARQTAAPLARLWDVTPGIDARIGEIPLPPDSGFRNHSQWMKYASTRRWPDMHESLQSWREQVLEALLHIGADTVVFSHFVAINVAVGHALRDDRVTCFQPDNCSCTVLDCDGQDLRIVELGPEAEIVLTK
jgi:broad specificity phosphatase PhoE